MEITSHSKLMEVLAEYPALEKKIIAAAPPFKNLRNPALRRTVGRLATLEMVARVGGLDVTFFVKTLRQAAGQPVIESDPPASPPIVVSAAADDPEWIAGQPRLVVDGTAMIRQGQVPLQRVNELLRDLPAGGTLLLITDFKPVPMLDAMRNQKREVFHKINPEDDKQHLTFIR
jgi:hypothetical protein